MATWYSVERGAETLEKTFDTYEEAELMALAMAVVNGEIWHANFTCGIDA